MIQAITTTQVTTPRRSSTQTPQPKINLSYAALGLAQFAGNFRNIVGDCLSPDTKIYKRDIGIDSPQDGDSKLIVRCYGDGWSVFFISFTDLWTRAHLYNKVKDDSHRSSECVSWGPDQDQANPPTDEKAQARVCFKAGGGLGIYWEPAVDSRGEPKYAGVLVARGTDHATLQKVWNDQT